MGRRWQRTLWIGLLGLLLAVGFAALPSSSSGVPGSSFVVDTTADSPDANPGNGVCADTEGTPHCSLRAAIQEANALATDDAITVPAGTYTLTIIGDDDAGSVGDLDVTGNTTITGAGEAATFVDGSENDRVFDIHAAVSASAPAVTLSRLTVKNGVAGNGEDGGGIQSNGDVTLDHVTVSNNLADGFTVVTHGGGISAWGGSLELDSSTVSGNTVQNYEGGSAAGGGIATQSDVDLTIEASTVDGNAAYGDCTASYGGGLAVGGPLTAEQSTISENSAGTAGSCGGSGGFGFGGGIYVSTGGDDSTLSGVTVSGNVAGGDDASAGGGIALDEDSGISISAASVISGNSSGSGGGIMSNGNVTVSASTIRNNSASEEGGAIVAQAGSLTVTGSTIRANEAVQNGGGIRVFDANLTMTGSTVSANTVTDQSGNGGGLDIHGETATAISNSTISGNSAHAGGGIAVTNTFASLTLSAATVAANSAPDASQLVRTSGTVRATNSLFAGNGMLCSAGAVTSEPQGHNLSQDTSCVNGSGDVIGVDPKLDQLADNGGPTFTHALLPGSPAIDAGLAAACPAQDQRGVTRPQGGGCDIGAFEAQSAPSPPPTTTTTPPPPPPPPPVLSIADSTHAEGDSGTTPFTFAVTLSAVPTAPVTVDWSTADGSATAGSGDYTAVAPTHLAFAAGQTSLAVTVLVNGDTAVEPNEVFLVNLSAVVGATIGDGQAAGTIVNDDESVKVPRGSNPCTITGTSGDDTIRVTVLYPTVVCGLSGTDEIHSGPGGGEIVAGPGNDTLYAGSAPTMITLGSGHSVVYACNGVKDTIVGGTGEAVVNADVDLDVVENVSDVRPCPGGPAFPGTPPVVTLPPPSSGSPACTVTGTSGDDTITVTQLYPVVLCGLAGNDVLTGGPGGGTIDAGSGNDTIQVGAASTTVILGAGRSTVDACNGKPDVIEGGSGPSVATVDKGVDTVKNVADVRNCNGGSNG